MNASDYYWPRDVLLAEPDAALPEPVLELRNISDVDYAFPAEVNPDWKEAPLKFFRNGVRDKFEVNTSDPWIRLAEAVFHARVDARKLRMLPRTPGTGEKAWRWADACLRSFELCQEYKEVVVAWILESFFYAYWFEDAEPDWVLETARDLRSARETSVRSLRSASDI